MWLTSLKSQHMWFKRWSVDSQYEWVLKILVLSRQVLPMRTGSTISDMQIPLTRTPTFPPAELHWYNKVLTILRRWEGQRWQPWTQVPKSISQSALASHVLPQRIKTSQKESYVLQHWVIAGKMGSVNLRGQTTEKHWKPNVSICLQMAIFNPLPQ